ncbi:hypothetical protein [Ectothiorhodospira mobilis]|uniref:hypothetical protein n=1 Tax=Ectothiorhodospira mobilis TaxID=195064 RepID=UPI0019031BB0|nr:hypothetical protein [Ectothiorhodospira mobilis]MBK1690816.1 hypothetical protein [Ectothiorhodospira mobilis]
MALSSPQVTAPAFTGRSQPAPSAANPAQGDARILADKEERLNQHADYRIIRRMLVRETRGGDAAPSRPNGEWQAQTAGVPGKGRGMAAGAGEPARSGEIPQAPVGASHASPEDTLLTAARLRIDAVRSQHLQVRMGSAPEPEPVRQADPLMLDLGGEGLATTGVEAGVRFDLTGDGRPEQVSVPTGDTWFLALDRDASGHIQDGRELFGDQHGAEHGFAELARFDTHRDGVIDARDPVFSRLRLLQLEADGRQQQRTLREAGVAAIPLDHRQTARALNAYDTVAQEGRYVRNDGSTGQAGDVLLGYRDRSA